MSVDRQHGKIIFICDGCDDTLETDERDFDDANAVFRSSGWAREKVGTEWVHSCLDCCGGQ